MVMAVMRVFKGYTLALIRDMPYCHFLKLYSLSETADALDAFNVLQGSVAMHDKKLAEELGAIKDSKFVQPTIVFPKGKG